MADSGWDRLLAFPGRLGGLGCLLLRGTGGGPSLMLNAHMDPGAEMSGWTVDPYGAKFEDGWIWGIGAHDDKGGCVAAIGAVDAVVRSGTRLKGDVIVTPATGAYGYAMASNYNGVPRPPVIFCSEGDARVVVRRESFDDLTARDVPAEKIDPDVA